MIWLASFILIIFLLGGVTNLGLFLRSAASWAKSEYPLAGKSLLAVALVNITFSSLGLYCLFVRILDPLSILIGVLLVTSLVEIALRMASKKISGAR